MPRGRIYVVLLVVLIAALAVTNAIRYSGKKVVDAGNRTAAPDISLAVANSSARVPLSTYRGKVLVLDFWATWCGPCRESIPELQKLYAKYHSQGLEVIGISVDQSRDPVPASVRQLGITYPIAMAMDTPEIRGQFEFSGIPQMYVIDKQGRVAADLSGYDPSRNIESTITPLLAE